MTKQNIVNKIELHTNNIINLKMLTKKKQVNF